MRVSFPFLVLRRVLGDAQRLRRSSTLRFVQQLRSQTSVSLWFSQIPVLPPFGFFFAGRSFSLTAALAFSVLAFVGVGIFFIALPCDNCGRARAFRYGSTKRPRCEWFSRLSGSALASGP